MNIGKTKVVPDDDEAAVLDDYALSARLLSPYADYLVVNVSSPNTPGLRNLQAVEKLQPLLEHVRRTADAATPDRRVPLLVKIAPDLSDDDVLGVADLALDDRARRHHRHQHHDLPRVPGDVPVGRRDDRRRVVCRVPRSRSAPLEVLRLLHGRVGDRLDLVSVGGLTTVEDARARLEAGAALLQGYTAFIYEGPLWPARIVRGLAHAGAR